jgi:hypothetical protein
VLAVTLGFEAAFPDLFASFRASADRLAGDEDDGLLDRDGSFGW